MEKFKKKLLKTLNKEHCAVYANVAILWQNCRLRSPESLNYIHKCVQPLASIVKNQPLRL